MIRFLLLCSASLVFASNITDDGQYTFGAYFANWAQYHTGQYKYTADKMRPIAGRVDDILYSFIYFCPPAGTSPMPYWAKPPFGNCADWNEYHLLSVEPKDNTFMPTIVGFNHPKLILSIGGWNFPSAYFSKMVSTKENRQKFITSAKSWLNQHNAKGIDIDWEYPCSAPRTDYVKITCQMFRQVKDDGGNCPADTNNLPLLMQEMREAVGNEILLSIASQASIVHADQMNLKATTPHIDYWNVMTYDYTVSDIAGDAGAHFNPNDPLYTPTGAGTTPMSTNYSIQHYLASGVPGNKIRLGIPFYAHTWYNPNLSGDDWKVWGKTGVVQGVCCGPFKSTYGAKFGKGCNQCGTMMFSEIEAAKPQDTYYDPITASNIGYFSAQGADGYTEKGTWITYNDVQSVKTITQYVKDNNLRGVFIFDTSMDSMEGGQFTYKLMNTIADTLGGH